MLKPDIKRLLMVFIDGLGLAPSDSPQNPVNPLKYPTLSRICRHEAKPVDPVLGVPGLPQSATGQASILCGINAQKIMNAHIEGFPGPKLQSVVKKHNIFKKLTAAGLKATFANAYWVDDGADIYTLRPRRVSVTTVAALEGLGQVRRKAALRRNEAVYQDLTRESLIRKGADIPAITPPIAAVHLKRIAEKHHFTLFEYFQTDKAGHAADTAPAEKVLTLLECFLTELMTFEHPWMIVSDHGNIEDMQRKNHTANPVPLWVSHKARSFFHPAVQGLNDITPAIMKWFDTETEFQ